LNCGGIFDVETKSVKISQLEKEMSSRNFWDDQDRARKISENLSSLKEDINTATNITQYIEELEAYLDILQEEKDTELEAEAEKKLTKTKKYFNKLETQFILSGPYDKKNALLEIHPGAGGTESNDWAEMLLRMYARWAENQDFQVELMDKQPGDIAGISSATLEIKGKYAYGYLKSEIGVHRLVRISPFDSNKRRHTSFASVFVYPEVDDTIEVDVNENDLRIDTFRASGAGGQHVNKVSSAVRITHIPTGIVAQCQSERSQLHNKENAMKVLKSRLYQMYKEKQDKERQKIENEKKSIEWGNQIRSYVFQPYSMVKDHRTDEQTGNVQAVMDGNIDQFIDAFLKNRSLK